MPRLIAGGLVVALGVLALGAGASRAATPAEVLCASYKNAVAKETNAAKRQAMIRSLPHGCEVRAPAPPPPVRRAPEPTRPRPVRPEASKPAESETPPEAIPEAVPDAVPDNVAEPLPPEPKLPDGVSVAQALKNGNKAFQNYDYKEALRWFSMAAGQGDAVAEADIGGLYFVGHGVPLDYAQTMTWYRRSAAQGNATAQDGIGALYARGQGVPTDYGQALKWFRLAAAQGNSDAQNWLGYFYTHGLGVSPNDATARDWYAKSRASKAAGR